MKKLITGIVLATVLTTSTVFATPKNIDVTIDSLDVFINNQRVDSSNLVFDNTTYLPLRAISEGVGIKVDYNDTEKVVNLTSGGVQKINTKNSRGIGKSKDISVEMDSLKVFVAGDLVDASNIVYNSTTYLPLRKISEATGTEVYYVNGTKSVYLYTPEYTGTKVDVVAEEAKAKQTQESSKNTTTSKPANTIVDDDFGTGGLPKAVDPDQDMTEVGQEVVLGMDAFR